MSTPTKSKTSKTAVSLHDRIKATNTSKTDRIYVEEWDAEIEVRSMTVAESDALGDLGENNGKFMAAVIAACSYDPADGERLFNNGDAEWLLSQPAGVVSPLFLAGLKVSGMTDKELESGKADS